MHLQQAMWRVLEWSFVMGALAWLFVRMWSESVYDRNRPAARRNRLQRFGSGETIRGGADRPEGPDEATGDPPAPA